MISWPDIAWQLLVYCAEAMASAAFSDYSPSREEMIRPRLRLQSVRRNGLAKGQAEELALLACGGMTWAFRKFRMFLDAARLRHFVKPDDVFKLPASFFPAATDFDRSNQPNIQEPECAWAPDEAARDSCGNSQNRSSRRSQEGLLSPAQTFHPRLGWSELSTWRLIVTWILKWNSHEESASGPMKCTRNGESEMVMI